MGWDATGKDEKDPKNFSSFFQKPIDKPKPMCYNMHRRQDDCQVSGGRQKEFEKFWKNFSKNSWQIESDVV